MLPNLQAARRPIERGIVDLPVQAHGVMVPEAPWEGPVVSIYSRALNVLHPGGLLVGVVAMSEQMSPFSLLVEQLFATDAGGGPPARISPGMICRRTGTELHISGMRLDLGPSRPWEGRLARELKGLITDPGSVAQQLRSALAASGAEDGLREVVVRGPSQTIFGRRAREILDGVRVDNGNGPPSPIALSQLVGLGIGFTPSGDDFISGVALAREMVGSNSVELDTEGIRAALGRTNHAGRTLLAAVLAHRFPAYLLEFAAAAGKVARHPGSSPDSIAQVAIDGVRFAAAHGETSGTDAVTGFVWYLGLLAG